MIDGLLTTTYLCPRNAGLNVMNDIRNLMDTLHTHVEYKEFANALRAPEDSWSVLQRIKQTSEQSARPAAPVAEPAPKARRSLLGRYAPASPADAVNSETPPARRAPLAEIFALLERQAP